MHPNVHSSTIYNSQVLGTAQVPISEWIKKLWYIYTMEYYEAKERKELRPFSTAWIKVENITLTEINQAVRDKYHMISPVSGT